MLVFEIPNLMSLKFSLWETQNTLPFLKITGWAESVVKKIIVTQKGLRDAIIDEL